MKYHNFIMMFFFPFFMINCEKEAKITSKDYPFVVMKEANVSKQGVTFVAEVIDMGKSQIESYGFVWDFENIKELYKNSFEIFKDTILGLGEYSFFVPSDFIKGMTYVVRPFVVTKAIRVYGNQLLFESNGAKLPILSDFNPKHGKSGDIITISGENFSLKKSRIKVLFGNDHARILLTDLNKVTCVLPKDLTMSGEVQIKLISGEETLTANEPFCIDGHRIDNFMPKKGIIGETKISITGRGFGPDINDNIVSIGGYKAIVLEASDTTIEIQIPFSMKPGNYYISILRGSMWTTFFDEPINIFSRWSKIPTFPGEGRTDSYFTNIEDKLYLICGGTNTSIYSDVWVYHINDNSWQQLDDFPGGERKFAIGFTIGENIYYGMGRSGNTDNHKDFWQFNTIKNQWKQLNQVPVEIITGGAIPISGLSKGYLIFAEIWEYNPLSDVWRYWGSTPKGIDAPRSWGTSHPFLSYSNAGYIINGTKLYYFNPSQSSDLRHIASVNSYYNVDMFLISNKIFFGGSEYSKGTFYAIDLSTKVITQIENFPGSPHLKGVSIQHSNMGFVGLGYEISTQKLIKDFYCYDYSFNLDY